MAGKLRLAQGLHDRPHSERQFGEQAEVDLPSLDRAANRVKFVAATSPTAVSRFATDAGTGQRLRLFLMANNELASRTIANLKRMLGTPEPRFEVVYVVENPERALTDRIYLTPTLIAEDETSTRRLIGDLADAATVNHFLREAPLATGSV